MRRATLALTAVALLTIAACSDDSSSASDTTGAPAATEAAAATTQPGATDDTVTDETITANPDAPGAGSEFCSINAELNDQDSPFTSDSTAAEVQAFFGDYLPQQLDRLRDTAPDELADDIETLAGGISDFTTLLESSDWDLDVALADPAVADSVGSAEYGEAGSNVDTYCGVD